VRLVHLGQRKGKLAAAPVLEPVDIAVPRGHRGTVTLDHGRHLLALVRMDDETDFVMSHAISLWIVPPAHAPLRPGDAGAAGFRKRDNRHAVAPETTRPPKRSRSG